MKKIAKTILCIVFVFSVLFMPMILQMLSAVDAGGSVEPVSALAEEPIEPEEPAEPEEPIEPAEPAEAEEPAETEEPVTAHPANASSLYAAWFDVITQDRVKAAISGIDVRFFGTFYTIDPADFADMVLFRDGVPVENALTFSGRVAHLEWTYREVTDFSFAFAEEIRTPGNYSMTGTYQGVPFTVGHKILETPPAGDTPADPAELKGVTWACLADRDGQVIRVSEISFRFSGIQQAFYLSDLTDLCLTLDGEPLAFSVEEYVFRYLEYDEGSGETTSFNLILCDALTAPGVYRLTGVYRGVAVTSMEITVK